MKKVYKLVSVLFMIAFAVSGCEVKIRYSQKQKADSQTVNEIKSDKKDNEKSTNAVKVDALAKVRESHKEFSKKKNESYNDKIIYESHGLVKASFEIDGKSSSEYYQVGAKQDGVSLPGCFYVHITTGNVYLNYSDGSIVKIPEGKVVGMYGNK